mgnify:CR=1 FL=1
MSLKEGLLLLGVLIALLCIPAAVSAAAGGTYITLEANDAKNYKGICIGTVDALDPLDTKTTSVTLQSTEAGDLKAIEYPLLGKVTREFDPASGTYQGAYVTVVGSRTVDGSTLPCEYQVYTTPTIPSFTVNVPGKWGNVLLVKCPENIEEGATFTDIFDAAEKEAYLFAKEAILYYDGTDIKVHGTIDSNDYSKDDLNFTLNENLVDLTSFRFNANPALLDSSFPKPDAREYLLTAVKYDSGCNTMHVLAAMPVLILDGNTPVTWSGDNPYYQSQNKGATVSFGNGVDRVAYALVKKDTRYDLSMTVNTRELANQPIPTTATDLVSILKSTSGGAVPVTYTLTPTGTSVDVTQGSGLLIAEGYGCSGYADASSVKIAAATLGKLKPGTYSLYALGMKGKKVVAVDQKEVFIKAIKPSSGGSTGGGGGGSSTSVGAASNLQSGDRVALTMDRTAISAITFTANTQIKDVMVTMAKGSLPRAAEPPAGTVYQYIEATLYRAVEDDLSNIWFRFAVPADWLTAQGCTADEVGLFRLTDDGWQEAPVEVLGEENGNALFAASPEGFSLFAIAATGQVPGIDEPTPEPTETETTPTADVTTPPADKPTTEPTPTPGFGALVALAGLGAGAVLVLRRE